MRRGRAETWGDTSFPGPPRLGLATWGDIGQSELMWRARCLPRVGAAFEAAWGLASGDGMLVSFDGAIVFRPPQISSAWRSRPALEWLHVDQGATKRGMVGVQGALLLYPQDGGSGGFACIPGSHQRHGSLVREHRHKDFVQFKADDVRLEGLGDVRLICAAAGDLVLWDSRCVHASQPADAAAPLPLDEAFEESAGVPRLARAACLISMVPAAPYITDTSGQDLVKARARIVEQSITTTHWPQETVHVSQGESASRTGLLARLSPMARALVFGERCEHRRRFDGRAVRSI
jgi:hypothetical protein